MPVRRAVPVARFIPACAGFCSHSMTSFAHPEVHPRVCGVLREAADGLLETGGSSPRVRGFVFMEAGQLRGIGFIPACAGF